MVNDKPKRGRGRPRKNPIGASHASSVTTRSSSAPPVLHPAEQYAQDVLDGKISVCRWVRLAVERHRRDLKDGHLRGLYHDPTAAQKVIDFFKYLPLKDEWHGQLFELQPWQQFIVWNVFGWKRADGLRRFRTVYIEVPRKNGKSEFASGIGLYMAFADGEYSAEVYSAATKRDQARITHKEAVRMVKESDLKRFLSLYRDNISNEKTYSKYEPLGADDNTSDGLDIHCGIVDEVHAHKTRGMWDVLETGTGARSQPLLFGITTSGFNKLGICYELRTYSTKILDNIIDVDDDTFFCIIYTIDLKQDGAEEDDDWKCEASWIKANPNYGVSVKPDDIARLCKKAIHTPTAENNFLTKRLNVWTTQVTKWMNMYEWSACSKKKIKEADLLGRECYAGVDLASKIDLNALALVFPNKDSKKSVDVLMYYWAPEENAKKRQDDDKVPYLDWAKQGLITLTPGNVVDYDFIETALLDLGKKFRILEVAYDPWNATQTAIHLQEKGVTMVEMRQGVRSMSEPMKHVEALVLDGALNHGDNPVLTWNMSNTAARKDANDNICPDKDKSTERIDGTVALIMGIGRSILHDPPKGKSVYETRNIVLVDQ